jgi:hypothetical protein
MCVWETASLILSGQVPILDKPAKCRTLTVISFQYRDSTSKSSLCSFEIWRFFWFERSNSIENAAWNDLKFWIVINATEYVCFRDLIFMIIASADIIIDFFVRFDLMNECDSFSILKFNISFWIEFKILSTFKSIWRKSFISIVFALNLWSRSEIISRIKRWVFFRSI